MVIKLNSVKTRSLCDIRPISVRWQNNCVLVSTVDISISWQTLLVTGVFRIFETGPRVERAEGWWVYAGGVSPSRWRWGLESALCLLMWINIEFWTYKMHFYCNSYTCNQLDILVFRVWVWTCTQTADSAWVIDTDSGTGRLVWLECGLCCTRVHIFEDLDLGLVTFLLLWWLTVSYCLDSAICVKLRCCQSYCYGIGMYYLLADLSD